MTCPNNIKKRKFQKPLLKLMTSARFLIGKLFTGRENKKLRILKSMETRACLIDDSKMYKINKIVRSKNNLKITFSYGTVQEEEPRNFALRWPEQVYQIFFNFIKLKYFFFTFFEL